MANLKVIPQIPVTIILQVYPKFHVDSHSTTEWRVAPVTINFSYTIMLANKRIPWGGSREMREGEIEEM